MRGISESYKGLIFAGFTATLWGFLAIALKVSLDSLNPVSIVWFRFTIAFIFLLGMMLIFDRSFITGFKMPPWILYPAAVFLGLNYFGFISGLHHTTPANAQIFIQVGPVSLALVGIIFFKEKITWKHITGFIILISGFSLFYSQQFGELSGIRGNYARGITYVVLAGLSWGGFSTIQKILVRSLNPNHLNVFIYGLCSLMFLPFVEFSKISSLTFNEWLLIVFLGLNTVFAYGSLALALKYAEANKVSVILTMNPVITFIMMLILEAALVSWIEYEHFTIFSLAGALMVLTGAVMVIIAGKRKL